MLDLRALDLVCRKSDSAYLGMAERLSGGVKSVYNQSTVLERSNFIVSWVGVMYNPFGKK